MHSRNAITTAILGAAAVLAITCLIDVSARGNGEEQASDEGALFDDGDKVVQLRDELSAQLEAVLADETSPGSQGPSVEERYRAAELLGRLQYTPAIPTLIRHVDLLPVAFSEPPLPRVADALALYGDAAVPQIVDACLKEDLFVIAGGIRANRGLFPLYYAIRKGETFETARTYARGIAAGIPDDAELAQKVRTFLEQLDKHEAQEGRRRR